MTLARAATAFWVARTDEADALAARALAQDPTNTWTWERHGMARLFGGGDPEGAIADFNRVLRLRGPSMSRINCLSRCTCQGRPIGGGFPLAPYNIGREPGCYLALWDGRGSRAGGWGPICR